MNSLVSVGRIGVLVAVAGVLAGCAAPPSKDEQAMRQAYSRQVMVTGSRVKQTIDDSGPAVGYSLDQLSGAQAQGAIREQIERAAIPPTPLPVHAMVPGH
jgi:type IV pilus biogenesis protein CpaD/CtpE